MKNLNKKDLEKVQGGSIIYVDRLPSMNKWTELIDHSIIYKDKYGNKLCWNDRQNTWKIFNDSSDEEMNMV